MQSARWMAVATLLAAAACGKTEGEPCGEVTEEGFCDGDVITFCQSGNLTRVDCAFIDCECQPADLEGNPFDEAICGNCPEIGTPENP